jgi:leucyl-tRNA synthetase
MTDSTHRERGEGYPFREIEPKWQAAWEQAGTFVARDEDPRPKLYLLEMFPYPSGHLHAGHIRNYAIGDAVARYWRMRGYNVLHPMGYDAFGLPAEQAAIDRGIYPGDWNAQCIASVRRQFQRYGFSFDWTRELSTSEPEYYRWTQWLFLLLYQRGLIYRKEIEVNWCEEHGVLANDEVKDGRCWRCDRVVSLRRLPQWCARTTAYAERLLAGIDRLPGWTEGVRRLQRNWIGESQGTHVDFFVPAVQDGLRVFTTRVDTVYGVTFMAVAPDHPLAARLAQAGGTAAQLAEFAESCRAEAKQFGPGEDKPKRGIALGVDCVNPFNKENVPVWATNYVLADFGTGAVMGVPGHDERDHAFALEHGLPVRQVIEPGDPSAVRSPQSAPTPPSGSTAMQRMHDSDPGSRTSDHSVDVQAAALTEKGVCINSGEFDGLDYPAAKAAMDDWLEDHGAGGTAVTYKLRDWNMGRQRFWGAPIPMVHCDKPEGEGGCGWQPVPEESLPVTLPPHADYSDIRVSPLANDKQWLATTCPLCGGPATRDSDTMTTFMDSAWYFLRFCDPANHEQIFDPARAAAWLPVDYYIGGQEHAVGHLLYSRFVTMVLHDAGWLTLAKPDHLAETPELVDEPFRRLFNQGIVYKDGAKMSKSKGNVVSSDELAEQFGADTARLFALFAGPADQDIEWTTEGVSGCHRFLKRVWRLAAAVGAAAGCPTPEGQTPSDPTEDADLRDCDEAVIRARHKAVAGVTEDMRHWRFNTAIAKLMELLNELEAQWKVSCGLPPTGRIEPGRGSDPARAFTAALLAFAQLLAPLAPHIAEELWQRLGGEGLATDSDWPVWDADALTASTVELPVQVNGKLRGRVTVPVDADEAAVFAAAEADEAVARWLTGEVVKRLYVPGRMVTFGVKG